MNKQGLVASQDRVPVFCVIILSDIGYICAFRGRCLASTPDRALVAFDNKVSEKMRKDGVVATHVNGRFVLIMPDQKMHETVSIHQAEPFPEIAVVPTKNLVVVRSKERGEPTRHEIILAESTGGKIICRPSQPLTVYTI